MPATSRVLLTSLLVCLTVASAASAQYRFDSFTTSSGLPQNTVSSVLQTRDGYLWIATYDGLVRYDGVRFTTFDKGNTPALRSAQLLHLFEDSRGALWAGTTEGGVLRYSRGVFTAFGPPEGLLGVNVERIAESPRGVLLFHPTGGRATLFGPDGSMRRAAEADEKQYVGPSGAVWTREPGRVTRASSGRITTYIVDLALEDFARYRFEARDGSLWTSGAGTGVHRLRDGAVTHFGEAEGVPGQQLVRLGGEDLAGRVWLYGTNDVFVVEGGAVRRLDLGLASPQIRAVFCDRENTVWVGTNSRGLIHVVPEVLHTYGGAEGLPAAGAYPLAEDRDGSILAGSGGTVARLSGGRFQPNVLPRAARSLFVDRDGTIWIGTSPGLMTMKDGRLADRSSLVPGTGIDVLMRDRAGALWAGGSNGLFRIDAAGVRAYATDDGLPAFGISAMLEDRAGRLWVATTKGLARKDGDRFVVVLAGDRVRSLYEDASGALWIGTFDSGLSRLSNGRVTTYTTRTGLFSNGVFAVLEDARGWLWMSSNRGISRVPRRQLEEVAEGTRTLVNAVAYGARDGMRSVECNGGRQSAGLAARDGRFWFPTQDGVVAVDPSRAYREGPPPAVAIESVLVDGVPVAAGDGVRVESGQRDVEINYTAPGFFKAEHTQFRYALDGLNAGWVDAGTRRTLHYSHLPPGTFTFRIQAADSEGRWSDAGTAVRIVVRPAFYQTLWFSGAVLGAMVLVGVGLSTLRVRRLQEAERRLTARIGEATAELASANRRLEQLATIDELTQLANRRRFSEGLEHEWQRAIREGTPLGLLMLDVDFFKRYNDTHGHQAGDACLQRVAAVLASRAKRPSDLAARYGGEEFVVVLPGTDEAGAVTVGEWIRAEVERQRVPHGASPVGEVVTVSVGAAVATPVAGTVAASLVAAADAALYRAKESGRNTVIAGRMDASPDAGAAATRLSRVRIHHPGS